MSDARDEILAGAPIDMGTFMVRAGAHYYSTRDPFGEKGDFITAPEISQMFGEMIGVWLADYWLKMGKHKAVNIVELGAGRGTLMADILRAAKSVDGFVSASQVHLVEISPVLRQAQRAALSSYTVQHYSDVSECPDDAPTLVIANEFFDALPVHQLVRQGSAWRERVVTAGATFDLIDGRKDLIALISDHLRGAPDGKIIEVSPQRIAMMEQVSALISKSGGAALIIDYGYDRLNYGDTVQAVFGHKFCGVLESIGEADITSHVDFGALMKACGAEQGAWFTSQGKFLTSMGVYQRMQVLKQGASAAQQADMEAALDRLCAPDKMGQLFKVLCVSNDKNLQPAGF